MLHTLDDLDAISWHLFNLIYFPFLFLVSPLLYFFVMGYLFPKRVKKKKELILYIPFLVYLGITLAYKFLALFTGRSSQNSDIQIDIGDLIDIYGDFINIPVIGITLIILFVTIHNYEKAPFKKNSSPIRRELLWLKTLLGILLATLIPWSFYTYKYYLNEDYFYLPIFVITSLLIYLLGYIGLHKIGVLKERENIRSISNERRTVYVSEKTKTGVIANIEEIVLTERKYLDPNFSLEMLANQLEISKSHLSRTINKELNSSFSDYINKLRIEEAKKYLHDPQFSKYTLVAIGLEAGFNSKTTFNTTFKKFTGVTPSQFKKSLNN